MVFCKLLIQNISTVYRTPLHSLFILAVHLYRIVHGESLRRNPCELKTLIVSFKRVITLGTDVDEVSKQSHFFLSRQRKGMPLARLGDD